MLNLSRLSFPVVINISVTLGNSLIFKINFWKTCYMWQFSITPKSYFFSQDEITYHLMNWLTWQVILDGRASFSNYHSFCIKIFWTDYLYRFSCSWISLFTISTGIPPTSNSWNSNQITVNVLFAYLIYTTCFNT